MPRPIRHMTKVDIDALIASRDLAVPPPVRGVHAGRGIHVSMPSAWDQQYGYPPPGWTGEDASWEDDSVLPDDWQTSMPDEDVMDAYLAATPPGTVTGQDRARINQAYAGNPHGTEPGPPPHANNPD